jgi:prepilin-type N-terminal cleavage/methylation domain-containing protein
MRRFSRQSRDGFTLIELLVVIGIISILAAVVLLAINPATQLGRARDTQRLTDINTILNALHQYEIDTNNFPPGIPTGSSLFICKSGAASCRNGVDLAVLTQSGKYLVSLPFDPQAPAAGTGTNYAIQQSINKRITIAAPGAEQSSSISVTR